MYEWPGQVSVARLISAEDGDMGAGELLFSGHRKAADSLESGSGAQPDSKPDDQIGLSCTVGQQPAPCCAQRSIARSVHDGREGCTP